MKKVIFIVVCILLGASSSYAQLDGLIKKAAKKATEKLMQTATDAATDAASDAIEAELGQKRQPAENESAAAPEQQSVAQLMAQLPELPSVQQLVHYKELEMKEQAMKLLMDPVTSFNTKVLRLSMQVSTRSVQGMDSAQVDEMAYRYAELATGLSREDLQKMEGMTEAEQQAYLESHYQKGTAETAVVQEAENAAQYLEPLQPLIGQWENFNKQIEGIYASALAQCKTHYDAYADRLSSATGEKRNALLLQYFQEIAPVQREAVLQALQIRLNSQILVAEQIEQQMTEIRNQHKDLTSALLNYPQLTAMQYFTEVSRLLEIPETF